MLQPVRFGKYTLLDRISVGGMAEVFRAKTADGKLFAIKRILPNVAEDQTFIKMFVEEARITGQLVHPNICRIFELGRCEGTHFIAMEYIPGKDLIQIKNRLRKLKQPMPLSIACGILSKALDGLEYAHKKRDAFARPLELVHRDCSPHNLLVSYAGEVKVIDFGIAKAKSTVVKSTVGVLKGKFAYMSPEQVVGKKIDRRSDVFSLGIVLYELVTGERLFVGDSDFAILEKVRHVQIRPPREIVPDLPVGVEHVILKALAADVDARYQWCSEMKGDLDRNGGVATEELSAWLTELFRADIAKEQDTLAASAAVAVSVSAPGGAKAVSLLGPAQPAPPSAAAAAVSAAMAAVPPPDDDDDDESAEPSDCRDDAEIEVFSTPVYERAQRAQEPSRVTEAPLDLRELAAPSHHDFAESPASLDAAAAFDAAEAAEVAEALAAYAAAELEPPPIETLDFGSPDVDLGGHELELLTAPQQPVLDLFAADDPPPAEEPLDLDAPPDVLDEPLPEQATSIFVAPLELVDERPATLDLQLPRRPTRQWGPAKRPRS